MRTKEISDFLIIDSLGPGPFLKYQINYTAFKEKDFSKEEKDDEILERFTEIVSSRYTSGMRRYIEEKAFEKFSDYEFKWRGDSYVSKPKDGKEINITFEEIGKVNLDAFIFNKNHK